MELLRERKDVEIQVDMTSISKSYVYESAKSKEREEEVLSDQINVWNSRIYEIPLDVIEVEEVTLD